MARILVVTTSESLATTLSAHLSTGGHMTESVASGFDGLDILKSKVHDLMLVDWELKDMSGLEVCRRYRSSGGNAIILMLSNQDAINNTVAALDDGADDILAAPVRPIELLTRVKALIRRSRTYCLPVLKAGELTIDTSSKRVFHLEKEIFLLAKEYTLLEFLIRNQTKSFTAQDILEKLWKAENTQSTDTVRTHIKTLRRKLGENNDWIITRRGFGYSFHSAQRQPA